MSVFELAKKYYPRCWDINRICTLKEAGKLTDAEYEEIIGEAYTAD